MWSYWNNNPMKVMIYSGIESHLKPIYVHCFLSFQDGQSMKESKPFSLNEHEYTFCYIFTFISTWSFGIGFISTKIKFAILWSAVLLGTCSLAL